VRLPLRQQYDRVPDRDCIPPASRPHRSNPGQRASRSRAHERLRLADEDGGGVGSPPGVLYLRPRQEHGTRDDRHRNGETPSRPVCAEGALESSFADAVEGLVGLEEPCEGAVDAIATGADEGEGSPTTQTLESRGQASFPGDGPADRLISRPPGQARRLPGLDDAKPDERKGWSTPGPTRDLNSTAGRRGRDLNSRGAGHQQLSRLPPYRTRLPRPG
jgi:hypothetical protein